MRDSEVEVGTVTRHAALLLVYGATMMGCVASPVSGFCGYFGWSRPMYRGTMDSDRRDPKKGGSVSQQEVEKVRDWHLQQKTDPVRQRSASEKG